MDGPSAEASTPDGARPDARASLDGALGDSGAGDADTHCEMIGCLPPNRCEVFTDWVTGELGRGCFTPSEVLCDPTDPAEAASCEGTVLTSCLQVYEEGVGNYGQRLVTDCRERLGYDDAVCVTTGSSSTCTAPEAVPCAPSTIPVCSGSLVQTCRGGLLVRERCTIPGQSCFPDRVAGREGEALCLGADAVEAAPGAVASLLYIALRCRDDRTIEILRGGYVYTDVCPDLPSGEATNCVVDGAGDYDCVPASEVVPCSPPGAPGTCSSSPPDATLRSCVDQGDGRWVMAESTCTVVADVPDHLTFIHEPCVGGACHHGISCDPGEPAWCGEGYRVTCDPVSHVWVSEPCPTTCSATACS